MADDEGTKIYERITDARRDPASVHPFGMMLLTLDALEMVFRPPTEEEVDASLNHIATGDELAHKVAGLLLSYLKVVLTGEIREAFDKWNQLSDAAKEYEEAMQ